MKFLPQIREMGVSRLVVDGIEVDLRPPAYVAPEQPAKEQLGQRDPSAMGLPMGVKVPSLRDRHG